MKNFFLFRFQSEKSILSHIEETHQRLQEQYHELAVTKDFYSHVMENLKEGVLWLDEGGEITFVNQGFLSIARYDSQEKVIGKEFTSFMPNETYTVMGKELLSVCRESPNAPETYDLNYKTSDGDERVGQTTCVWVESSQQKPGFLLSIRDITEKRVIERKLFAVQNRYRSLYENSPAIIIGVDLTGNFLFSNPAFEEQSGYSEEALKKMHFAELVAPAWSNVDAAGILAQRIGKVGMQEMHYRTKAGEWKSLALATYPLYDDKWEVIGVGGIGVDVTETKRLNEILMQTQRMELLGQMAGGLAHDFKNLLAVISGYGRLIMDISTEPKIQEFASNIMIANDRAAGLTKNLLTFSRGGIVKNEPFLVNDVVEEVKKLLPPILGRTIKLFVEVAPKRYLLKGDAGKIHQCILNLCINARDALLEKKQEGKVTLRLKDDADPAKFVIEVEDNGPGISPDIIGRIFDPFFTTKKKQEGTGLGLSVVYGIVKAHGGEITVDSRPGEGATFRIVAPVHVDEKSAEAADRAAARSVLVIDSDEVARQFCDQILRRQGYAVVHFSSIVETNAWFETNKNATPIALFPVSQAAAGVELSEARKNINVIWISENGTPAPAGAELMLRRPFPPAALIETVKAAERKINANKA